MTYANKKPKLEEMRYNRMVFAKLSPAVPTISELICGDIRIDIATYSEGELIAYEIKLRNWVLLIEQSAGRLMYADKVYALQSKVEPKLVIAAKFWGIGVGEISESGDIDYLLKPNPIMKPSPHYRQMLLDNFNKKFIEPVNQDSDDSDPPGLPLRRDASVIESITGLGLSERIKILRESVGMTQRDVARRSGLTIKTISAIESDPRTNPTINTLQKLADALNVSVDRLIGGKK